MAKINPKDCNKCGAQICFSPKDHSATNLWRTWNFDGPQQWHLHDCPKYTGSKANYDPDIIMPEMAPEQQVTPGNNATTLDDVTKEAIQAILKSVTNDGIEISSIKMTLAMEFPKIANAIMELKKENAEIKHELKMQTMGLVQANIIPDQIQQPASAGA